MDADPNYQYKNGTAASGYGLFSVNAASFQEYFLSGSNCEGQAKSSIGLIGPFFHDRHRPLRSRTRSVCSRSNVHRGVAAHCNVNSGTVVGMMRFIFKEPNLISFFKKAGSSEWASEVRSTRAGGARIAQILC